MPVYYLLPQDVLYFGGGQQPRTPWPAPCVVFDALHAALHRAYPQVQLWERLHAFGVNGTYANRREKPQRFGSLQTVGPFPSIVRGRRAAWYFPAPATVRGFSDGGVVESKPRRIEMSARGVDFEGAPDSPASAPGESAPPSWWSKEAVEAWLAGCQPAPGGMCLEKELFAVDPIIENRLSDSPASGAPRRSVAYLRCRDDVVLGCLISLTLPGEAAGDGLAELFAKPPRYLVLGGRQRLCRVVPAKDLTPLTYRVQGGALPPEAYRVQGGALPLLPVSSAVVGERVKWLLLSPAIFPPVPRHATKPHIHDHPGGWLPNWVCPATGQVLLRKGMKGRSGPDRAAWRQSTRELPPLDCRLVAASIPPLINYQGWSERRHLRLHLGDARPGPKPLNRTVPAGAVYYFEGPDAPELARLLSWHGEPGEGQLLVSHRRSTLLGEKGFGLGVCGPWTTLGEALRERAMDAGNPATGDRSTLTPGQESS